MDIHFSTVRPVVGVTGWSVSEEALSYDQAATEGSLPTLSVQGIGKSDLLTGRRRTATLSSQRYGKTQGSLDSVTTTPFGWAVEGSSGLAVLNVDGLVQPLFNQPYDKCVNQFFQAVTKWLPDVRVSKSISNLKASVPTFRGNVWVGLKQWLQANLLDIAWIDGKAIIMPQRSNILRLVGQADNWQLTEALTEPFTKVSCYVYHRKSLNNGGTVYPHPPTQHECDKTATTTPIITVDSGKTVEVEIMCNAELVELKQPVHVLSVPKTPNVGTYPTGCYAVIGKDNKPITPAQWSDEGGQLTVKVSDKDPRVAVITITAPVNDRLGPFRVAESDGKTDYSALHLVGTGSSVSYEKISMDTTAIINSYGASLAGEVEVTIDNPAIDTPDKAMAAIAHKMSASEGDTLALTWSGINPVRLSFTDSTLNWALPAPTLNDVTLFTGQPLPQKAEEKWPSGTTMQKIKSDIDQFMASLYSEKGKQQVFGRIAGARAFFNGWWFRVDKADISDRGISLQASLDMRLEDLQRVWPKVSDMPLTPGTTLRALSRKGLS